ncbi:hypothetical protein RJT34_25668 [Clitoria ternatea]|uniref:CTLH domain-containing protein n=1 Tax=Clitoria ternatea TaxID=43366 RepID=A0AAN9FWY2_CLITE
MVRWIFAVGASLSSLFCKPLSNVDNTSATCFLLHCQKFIELVRVGALEEAVKYGRIQLSSFFGLPVFEDLVQDCVALLAYARPLESSVGYLLKDSE